MPVAGAPRPAGAMPPNMMPNTTAPQQNMGVPPAQQSMGAPTTRVLPSAPSQMQQNPSGSMLSRHVSAPTTASAARPVDLSQRSSSAGVLVGSLQAGLNQTAAGMNSSAGGVVQSGLGMTSMRPEAGYSASTPLQQQQQQTGTLSASMPAYGTQPQYASGQPVLTQQHSMLPPQPVLTGAAAQMSAPGMSNVGILTGDKRPRDGAATGGDGDKAAAGKKAKGAADAKKGAKAAGGDEGAKGKAKEEFENDLFLFDGGSLDLNAEEASLTRVARSAVRHKCTDQPFLDYRYFAAVLFFGCMYTYVYFRYVFVCTFVCLCVDIYICIYCVCVCFVCTCVCHLCLLSCLCAPLNCYKCIYQRKKHTYTKRLCMPFEYFIMVVYVPHSLCV
jgi:hypothetical protein